MLLDIGEIGREGIVLDAPVRLSDLEGWGGEKIPVRAARLWGRAVRGRRGVELRASLEATVELRCSRCIETFLEPIATDVFLRLVPEAVEFGSGETRMDPEEATLFYTKNGKADLDLLVAEQIYLCLPLKPVCHEDCRGLCPNCGANRNRTACPCRVEEPDPRLAPLLEFRMRNPGP